MLTQRYLPPSPSLDSRVKMVMSNLGLNETERQIVFNFLAPLRSKGRTGKAHYRHSLRVGLLAHEIGRHLGVDDRALFYAGLLHDVGKALVDVCTLGKTNSWTKADSIEMMTHVMDGYRMLRGSRDLTAEIVVRHHRYQPNCYPDVVPAPLHPYSPTTMEAIQFYSRMLAMADVFDALHRINFRDGVKKALTAEQIKTAMLKANPDMTELVNELYSVGIFRPILVSSLHNSGPCDPSSPPSSSPAVPTTL